MQTEYLLWFFENKIVESFDYSFALQGLCQCFQVSPGIPNEPEKEMFRVVNLRFWRQKFPREQREKEMERDERLVCQKLSRQWWRHAFFVSMFHAALRCWKYKSVYEFLSRLFFSECCSKQRAKIGVEENWTRGPNSYELDWMLFPPAEVRWNARVVSREAERR